MTEQRKINDEFALIEQLTEQFVHGQSSRVLVPPGDDAAIFKPTPAQNQVIAIDTLVEGVHFTRETMSPEQIGFKALAVNLSDIAAMGGRPSFFLVSLAVSPHWTDKELQEMYTGMRRLAKKEQVDLLGGDTVTTTGPVVITVTALGEVPEQIRLVRSQVRAGYVVFVTGPLGNAAAGLHLLQQDHMSKEERVGFAELLQAHQEPYPHIKQGQLISRYAHEEPIALNDVSDGLASEANELARASGVDLVLEKEKLPLSGALVQYARRAGMDPYQWALSGGEDFVLVGAASPAMVQRLQRDFTQHGLKIHQVGYALAGEGRVWLETDGKKHILPPQGYNHFRNRENK